MRTLAFLLLTVFSFQIMDVPPTGAYHPHTCCGRAICMCHHAKGAPCPFRLTGQDDPVSLQDSKGGGMHAHCHLEQKIKTGDGMRHLTQAPCHTETPKSTASGATQDFEHTVKAGIPFTPAYRFLSLSSPQFALLTASSGIERPPRVF